MPNHFHLMVYVKRVEIPVDGEHGQRGLHCTDADGLTRLCCTQAIPPASDALTARRTSRTLNDSIGIMLRSYTRAINKQEGWTGSLFRKETKSVCLSVESELFPSWYMSNGVTNIVIESNAINYLQTCFNYIHLNPVRARLVCWPEQWQYLSAKEYKSNNEPCLVNKKQALELGLSID